MHASMTSLQLSLLPAPLMNSCGTELTCILGCVRYRLHIVGERVSEIHNCLLALPGTRREDVRRVISDAVALSHCDAFVRSLPGVVRQAVDDTAQAAKIIAENGWRSASSQTLLWFSWACYAAILQLLVCLRCRAQQVRPSMQGCCSHWERESSRAVRPGSDSAGHPGRAAQHVQVHHAGPGAACHRWAGLQLALGVQLQRGPLSTADTGIQSSGTRSEKSLGGSGTACLLKACKVSSGSRLCHVPASLNL